MYGSGSTYTDVDALAGLTNLTVLRLPMHGEKNTFQINGLAGLTNLTELDMECSVESLEPLRGLTNLRTLSIQNGYSSSGKAFSSLEPLSGLTNLTELNVRGNVAGSLSALSGLTELRVLQIQQEDRDYTRWEDREVIRDLSPLSGLTKLSSLTVYGAAENIDTSPVSFVSDLNINN